MIKLVLDKEENIVGKVENPGYKHLHLQAFTPFYKKKSPKAPFLKILKTSRKKSLPSSFASLLTTQSLLLTNPNRRKLWKKLWEKEKMLVTSIFSFFHSVFHSIKDRNHHYSSI